MISTEKAQVGTKLGVGGIAEWKKELEKMGKTSDSFLSSQ